MEEQPCVEAEGYRLNGGHIRVGTTKGRYLAHIRAWEKVTGAPPPPGRFVCHTCDNPGCIQTEGNGVYVVGGMPYPRRGHLWLGTHGANMLDKRLKKRSNPPHGEAHKDSRLTADDVRYIRAHYRTAPKYSQGYFSRRFGVSQNAIHKIVRRVTWDHIT